jgi:superoxide dismutase
MVGARSPHLKGFTMSFALPALPYADTALEPTISAKTLSFHYGKHHKAYSDNLIKMAEGKDWANKSLEDVIHMSAGKADMAGVFNNSAQIWNHTFLRQFQKRIRQCLHDAVWLRLGVARSRRR